MNGWNTEGDVALTEVKYRCCLSGAIAAHVVLIPKSAHAPEYDGRRLMRAAATLLIEDACGSMATAILAEDIADVQARLEHDAAHVGGLAGAALTRSYCPECEAIYCRSHWRMSDTFEDLMETGDGAWHDATYGVCPNGHRRMLDD